MADSLLEPIKKELLLYYEAFFRSDIPGQSAQVAFYLSFAVFPFLYFIASVFGMVVDASDSLRHELYSYLKQLMPDSVYSLVTTTLDEVIAGSSGSKITFSLLITVWSASAGLDALRNALNAIFEIKEERTYFRTKFHSLILTVVLALLSITGVAIVFYGWRLFQMLLAYLGIQTDSGLLLSSLQWVAIFTVLLITLEMVYNLLPYHRRSVWHWITAGSFVAMILWIVSTTGFRIYLQYFNSYNRTYGSIGAVIIMMLWFYLTSMAVLIGGMVNAERAKAGDQPAVNS